MIFLFAISGSYESVPLDAWQVREDVKGKGGLIRELPFNKKLANNPVKGIKGENELIFHFSNASKAILASSIINNYNLRYVLQIVYLRSYENGGIAEIYYCNKLEPIGTLNALWADYAHYKYSLPTAHSIMLEPCSDPSPTIKIVHQLRTEYGGENLVKHMGTQKVKIISLKVCALKFNRSVSGVRYQVVTKKLRVI